MKIIKEIPITEKWTNYLKTLPNKAKVWDFNKIDNNFKEINIRIIFSERGNKGKTYNLKHYALECFNKNGKPSIWVRNTAISLKLEAKRFLDNATISNDPIFWKNLQIKKQGPIYLIVRQNKVVFILLSLNDVNKMKGTRLDVNHIIFDEINEDASQIRGGIIKAIDSLVHSATNAVKNYNKIEKTKLWFLGNNKSINHPYLIKLGIRDNKHPLALYSIVYKQYKRPLAIRFCAQYNAQEISDLKEKAFKDNDWKFIHSFVLDEANHSYFNKSFENEELKVLPLDLKRPFFKYCLKFTLKYEDNYLNFYDLGILGRYTNTHYHIAKVDKQNAAEKIITNYPAYVDDDTLYLGTNSRLFSVLLNSQNLTYQDSLSRILFLNNCFGKIS